VEYFILLTTPFFEVTLQALAELLALALEKPLDPWQEL